MARVGSGLSLRAVADACGTSHQQVLRFEQGQLGRVAIADLGAWFAVVGMDLVIRAYPAGDPIRDSGQQRLLQRLRVGIHVDLTWTTEVVLPIHGDQRAWDAVIRGRGWWIAVEAETVLDDLQALERRIARKVRDGGSPQVLLLISDTRRNRQAIAAAPSAFIGYDRDARSVLALLSAGRDPDRSALVFR